MSALFSFEWSRALGWTLFHSIWQSAIILLMASACLRFLSPRRSDLRYGILCGAMLLFVLTACITFFSLNGDWNERPQTVAEHFSTDYSAVTVNPETTGASFPNRTIGEMAAVIDANMSWVLLLWSAGFLFFSIRFSAAFLYTRRIKALSTPLQNEWAKYIADTAARLGIRRMVGLARATTITSPMVIGYLKPVILVPTSMLSGLTAEQLETIFLHELAHIRRHDYLVNLLQSLVETFFFFNPFVWILSNLIRREREYCCDDLVVRCHGGTRAYAYALVHLAEARLGAPGFALALGNNKNQLLHRIKRIMERSVRNYSGKSRLAIPVIVLGAALMCISLLGMQKDEANLIQGQQDSLSATDTVPAKKGNRASYTRKSIITIDKNGQPHEEVVEEFEGDESLRPLMEKQFEGFTGTNPPGFPPFPSFTLPGLRDTIPPAPGIRNTDEWEEYARSMAENFRSRFKIFEDFPHDSLFMKGFADKWERFGLPDTDLRALDEFNHAEVFKQLEEEIGRLRGFDFDEFANPGLEFSPLDQTQGYEKALREQLLKDGYLDEGESIQSLQWSNDQFKVNGKSIEKADREKYQKLNDKFFGGPERSEELK